FLKNRLIFHKLRPWLIVHLKSCCFFTIYLNCEVSACVFRCRPLLSAGTSLNICLSITANGISFTASFFIQVNYINVLTYSYPKHCIVDWNGRRRLLGLGLRLLVPSK